MLGENVRRHRLVDAKLKMRAGSSLASSLRTKSSLYTVTRPSRQRSPRQGQTIRVRGEGRAIVGVIEHLLDEALDCLARLLAQVACDARLHEPRLLDQIGHGAYAGGRCEGE